MYKLKGFFTNGSRYTETFSNKDQLSLVCSDIIKNRACRFPDTITGKKDPAKVPAYIRKFMRVNDMEYVKE